MRLMTVALSLLTLMQASEAGAELYCVTTPTQFLNAVSAAAGGSASEIRVRAGGYNFTATASTPAITIGDTSDLAISGGWNNDCTHIAAASPEQTVLSAQGLGRLIRIQLPSASSPSIEISRLSLRGGAASNPIHGGCVTVDALVNAGALIAFDLVSFRQCSGGTAALAADVNGATLRLRGSLVTANTIGPGSTVFLRGLGGAIFHISNNTIAHNPASSGGRGLYLAGGSSDFYWITNNVLSNNATANDPQDLFVETGVTGVMNSNLVGVQNSVPASLAQISALSGDPGFQSPTDLRPRRTSAMRNSGNNSPVGGSLSVDFDLASRLMGGRIDRGAFEYDEYFINGFE